MILVDTSVLIDYLKGIDNKSAKALDEILENGMPYGINDFIYQEIEIGSEKWIIAKEIIPKLMSELNLKYKVKNEFKGKVKII